MNRPGRANAALVSGCVLLSLTAIPIVQQVRDHWFRTAGRRAYTESPATENPLRFGGRVLRVEDRAPDGAAAPNPGAEVWRTARVLLDGAELLTEAPLRVRTIREQDDLGRYHFWIYARIFEDRATGAEQLWLGRRVHQGEGPRPLFEVVTVDRTGAVTVDTVGLDDRADSYPLYRTLRFLSPAAMAAFEFTLLDGWPGLFVPVLFPWVAFGAGLLATGWGMARTRRAG